MRTLGSCYHPEVSTNICNGAGRLQLGRKMPQKRETATDGLERGQRMIFTGPDGIGDYMPKSNYFPGYIGVGAMSTEATGDLSYLCRAAPDAHPYRSRQSYVGEVGWGWQYNQLLNSGTLLSNMQIKKTELRASLEDRVTQKFQSNQKNMTDDSQEVKTKSHRESRS